MLRTGATLSDQQEVMSELGGTPSAPIVGHSPLLTLLHAVQHLLSEPKPDPVVETEQRPFAGMTVEDLHRLRLRQGRTVEDNFTRYPYGMSWDARRPTRS